MSRFPKPKTDRGFILSEWAEYRFEQKEKVEGEVPVPFSNLEYVPFLYEGEEYVNGWELIRRAREELNANLGLMQAAYLHDNEEVPVILRYPVVPCPCVLRCLVFPGSIWGHCSEGGTSVLCMTVKKSLYYPHKPYWSIETKGLGSKFDWRHHLLRPRG